MRAELGFCMPTIAIKKNRLHLSKEVPTVAILDGDGTTIDHGGVIPRTVRESMIHIRKAGGLTILATGRTPWTLTDKENQAFKTDVAVVTENGVRTRIGGLIEIHRELMPDEIQAIVASIATQRNSILYAIAFPKNSDEQPVRWVLDEANMTSAAGGRRGYAAAFMGTQKEIEQIWLAQKPGLILIRPRKGIEEQLEFPQELNCIRSDQGACEVTPLRVSKKTAAQELLTLLDVSPQVILAMGNGLNDDHLEIKNASRILVGANGLAIARFGDLSDLERVETVREAGQKMYIHAYAA